MLTLQETINGYLKDGKWAISWSLSNGNTSHFKSIGEILAKHSWDKYYKVLFQAFRI